MSDATPDVRLIRGPLQSLDPSESWPGGDGAGAVVVFEGVVRSREGDGTIEALDYAVYLPMTERHLRRLALDVGGAFSLIALAVEHSVGRVAVGETSFRLRVAAAHRREALDATDTFIERMKRDVPIWKTPVWRENSHSAWARSASAGTGTA